MTTRRLAAILAADVVGFSSLMERDEEGTLAKVKMLQREVIEPNITQHHGRVVKTTGDGFLVEFASPVEAVRCATTIQDVLKSDPVQLRIGINLGDILIENDGDVFGDGVNIAARLEGLSDPGGICVSGAIYDQIEGKIDCVFESRGEQQVKNIARPVRVYASKATTATGSPASAKPLPLPDKPSIAVLPFTNMSTNPETELFADGITEDITTALARLKWLFVIARNSAFSYKGKAVDVRQVARDLGVRYVLEGSVRASGQRIRITGQLIDAEMGKHIWAERYDRNLDDIFAVQDEITGSVVATIEPRLYAEEGLRAERQTPGTITTWGLVVRAIGLISKVGRRENEDARQLLERAIVLEPTYAKAHGVLSWAVWWAASNYWLPDEQAGKGVARQHAEKALALDPGEAWGRLVLGLFMSQDGEHERALQELEAVLRGNPSFALGHGFLGMALSRAGRHDAAVAETTMALRLSPSDPYISFYEMLHGVALLKAGQFREALPFLRRSVVAFPEFPARYTDLISCLGHLGLVDEAKPLLAQRNKLGPRLTVSLIREQQRKFRSDVYIEGLMKAGVPEE